MVLILYVTAVAFISGVAVMLWEFRHTPEGSQADTTFTVWSNKAPNVPNASYVWKRYGQRDAMGEAAEYTQGV